MSNNKSNSGSLTGDALYAEVEAFRDSFSTVLIATTDQNGSPNASYAPYVVDSENNLYVFLSGLARHTGNLLTTGRSSLLFIADEEKSPNLFARQRLALECLANELNRKSHEGNTILDDMELRFGAIIRKLRTLADFRLIQLIPVKANYVKGFGAAYQWPGAMPQQGNQPLEPIGR